MDKSGDNLFYKCLTLKKERQSLWKDQRFLNCLETVCVFNQIVCIVIINGFFALGNQNLLLIEDNLRFFLYTLTNSHY